MSLSASHRWEARLISPDLRCAWRSRVLDHDGYEVEDGGIARYLQLTAALGLDRDYVISTEGILPATRFAVDAYVNFVSTRSELEMILGVVQRSTLRGGHE